MRIALVYPSCHRRGGVERVVWEAARFLAGRHDVTVVCSAGLSADLPADIAVVGVRTVSKPALILPVAFRLAAWFALRRLKPDVTVSFGFDCPGADVLVVQSVHASWLEKGRPVRYGPLTIPPAFRRLLPRHQIRLLLERYTLRHRRPDRLIAVSDNVADDLIRLYDFPPAQLDIVPNGFDPEQCSPQRRAELRPAARRDAGLTDEVALVMVANEWHRKGLGVLIEAMRRLPSPPVLLLVGRMAPAQYADQMEAAGLAARVKYLGAMDDVAVAYAAGDLFVLPTQYEAFGTVIVEALACGVPVVTTVRAGASTVVHPGVNGLLLVDPDDAGELEGLLRQALTAPETLTRWAEAARPAVEGYQWSELMARIQSIIVATAEGA